MSKRDDLKRIKTKFDHSFVFSCFHLRSPKKKPLKFYYNSISLPWPLAFSYQTTSFASPTAKPVGPCKWIIHALEYVCWGPQIAWSLIHSFSLNINRSGPGTSSTTNHNFTGPWDDFMVHGVNNPLALPDSNFQLHKIVASRIKNDACRGTIPHSLEASNYILN